VDTLRHHYMKTLGIVEYIPREFMDDGEVICVSVEKTEAMSPLALAKDQLLAKISTDVAPQNKTTLDVSKKDAIDTDGLVETALSDVEPEVSVRLLLWQVSDKLLVCAVAENELPDSHQITLLDNIIRAVTGESKALPQLEVAQWPPFSGIQGGTSEARAFLSTLISARLSSYGVERMLLLGNAVRHWVLPDIQAADANTSKLTISSQTEAVTVPDLSNMVTDRKSKRYAWEIVKAWSPMARVKPAATIS
jgi:hypothetical protein